MLAYNFFLPNYHFLLFCFLLQSGHFFYASLSPPSPTSKLTSMLPKNLLFFLYCQADLFVTQGGQAEPRRA